MKRPGILIGSVLGVVITTSLVAACGGAPGSEVGTRTNAGVAERIVTLSDGRTVTCITIQSRGISCDFAGATP